MKQTNICRLSGDIMKDNVYSAVIMSIIARVDLVHLMNTKQCTRGCHPPDQADRLEPYVCLWAPCKLQPPLLFIITQPENWYSVYCPMDDKVELTCVTALVVTYLDVCIVLSADNRAWVHSIVASSAHVMYKFCQMGRLRIFYARQHICYSAYMPR